MTCIRVFSFIGMVILIVFFSTPLFASVGIAPEVHFQEADTTEVQELLRKSQEFAATGNYTRAKELMFSADSLSDLIQYQKGREKSAVYLADVYVDEGNFEKAVEILKNAVKKYPGSQERAQFHNILGSAYDGMSEFEKAIEEFNTALEFFNRLPKEEQNQFRSGILHNLAVVYQVKGEKTKALENFITAIRYAEAARDTAFLTIIYNNLGMSYNSSEEYEESVYYLEKSLEYAQSLNSKIDIYRAQLNLANTLSNMGRYEEALSRYEIAGNLFTELRPDVPPAIILHNQGATLAKMERYEKAEELLDESLQLSTEMGIPQGIYFNHHVLGQMFYDMGKSEESIYHLENAVDVAVQTGNADFIQSSRDILYKAYAQANNYEDAYEALKLARAYSDSLTNIDKERTLAELENQLALDRQNEINRLLQEKQAQQEQQLQFQYFLIIVGALVLVLIIVILFVMRKLAREREEINTQLQQQKKELEEVNNAKDKLFAIIAHDLRSPLTSMQGFLSLIKDNVLSKKEISGLVPELELSVQKNVDVMEDLLAWAKEQLSGVKMDIKPTNIYDVVSDIISSQSYLATKKGVSIISRVPEQEEVLADLNALHLAIRNVITNGIKFSSEGKEIEISVEARAGYTQLIIKDTGIGIPENVADKIFESNTWTRQGTNKEKGTGFGLSLTKEFIEKMNGRIWFESKEGEGSTFYIELPRAQS